MKKGRKEKNITVIEKGERENNQCNQRGGGGF